MKRILTVLVKDELEKALQLKPQKEVMAAIDVTTITMNRITEALQIRHNVTIGRKAKYTTDTDMPFKDEIDPRKEKEKQYKKCIDKINKVFNTSKKEWEEIQKTLTDKQQEELNALREIKKVETIRRKRNNVIKKTKVTNLELLNKVIEYRKQEKEFLESINLPLIDIEQSILKKLHTQVKENKLEDRLNEVKIELNL